jgi:hypothetical protein
MSWLRKRKASWPGWYLVAAAAFVANSGLALAQGSEPVALELVLALDSSSSVSAEEFDLQRQGISWAFRDPGVQEAIANLGDQGLVVAVIQWSGGRMQRMSVDWTHLHDESDLNLFASAVALSERLLTGGTNLGGAVRYSLEQIETNQFEGRRKVIDVSGDGFTGLSPRRERDRAVSRGVTINGLAILNERPELGIYYATHLVGGAGAFVLTADSYEDFTDAIRDKLLRELSGSKIAAAELNTSSNVR